MYGEVPQSSVVGAALSADVDAPTERPAFWKGCVGGVNRGREADEPDDPSHPLCCASIPISRMIARYGLARSSHNTTLKGAARHNRGPTMQTSNGWDTRYEFKAVLVMSLAFGLVGLDRFILLPLLPSISKDLGLNYTQGNTLVSALAVAWGIAAIFAGSLSDHLGRRAVLVPSVVLFSLLSVFSGMAGGLTALVLIRALMGVSEGAVASTGVAVTVEASHPKRRGMNNGFFQCSISFFGLAVAPILATQLLEVTSWRNVFYIVGIPGLIVAVFLHETAPRKAGTSAHGEVSELDRVAS